MAIERGCWLLLPLGLCNNRYTPSALATANGLPMEPVKTTPKCANPAANRRADERAACESAGQLVVREPPAAPDPYLHGLAHILDEWNSPEDERAWRDL